MRKKDTHSHSSALAERLWRLNSGYEHSEMVSGEFQQWQQKHEKQVTFWTAMYSCHMTKWRASWSAHSCKLAIMSRELYTELNISFSVVNNSNNVGISQSCARWVLLTHRKRKNTLRKFARIYWISSRLKVTVSWITSLLMTKHGVTTMSQSKNGSRWNGNMWIPYQRKSLMPSSEGKMTAIFFGIGNVWLFLISWNPDKLSTLIATSQNYLSWRLELPDSGQKIRHPFSFCYTCAILTTMEHTANIGWIVLPHPPYSSELKSFDFHLFRPMKNGLCGQHFPSNNTIIAAVNQQVTSTGADF